MKKILLLLGLLLLFVELQSHGACLLENMQKQNACTGGASNIGNQNNIKQTENNDTYYDEIKNMYQIPTISTPTSFRNNFPMLNQNCTFGMCFPR